MARNRKKAKQRKARQEARAKKGGAQPAGSQPSGTGAGAPPEDEGAVKASASVDAKKEIQRTAKLKPEAPSKTKSAPDQPKQKGRLRTFLRSSWAELRRVQWPDRKQMTTMTSIVIGFVAIAGLYLGVIDWAANRVVDFILF